MATDGDRAHLVEQYRHPVARRSWELPSGSIDPRSDAEPEQAALRGLREETGLVAGRLLLLGVLEVSPSTLNQRCHGFWAADLSQGSPQLDAAEADLRSAWFSRDEVSGMMRGGTIKDATSLAAWTLLLLHALPPASSSSPGSCSRR